MKVNIIGASRAVTGLAQDQNLLRGMLTLIYDKDVNIAIVPHMYPQCRDADVNFFLEVINPSLFFYARKNIWIPNPEWTYKSWIPYLNMVDEIWVKTHEAEKIFKSLTTTPVKYIGWSSIDKYWNPEEERKNYYKAIVPVGKNIYRHPQTLFDAYSQIKDENISLYKDLPMLYIVHSPEDVKIEVPEKIDNKVVLHSKVMSQNDYDDLLKECGLCICLSKSEGFCHAVNEAMSAGCNVMLSYIDAFVELAPNDPKGSFFPIPKSQENQEDRLGVLLDTDIVSLKHFLGEYVQTSLKDKKIGSENCREIYCNRHNQWIQRITETLKTSLDVTQEPYLLKDHLPKEEELPDVSILCITKDRRIFMPILKYCYMIQSYPEDKLELVIVDDGDDSIEDTLIGVPNVKYVRCEEKLTISQKRNLAVENAMYDILVTMDDDDIYPNNSVLQRVAMLLLEPAKECAFCTTIPCYDIVKFSSFMNVPPTSLAMSERVSEASLIFTRKFWQERKFDDEVHVGEGNAFIHGREQMCRELSPQEVIVSLIHPKNTSSRRLPEIKEPNGCHWGFNEKLFAMVTQIGEALNPKT